MGDDQNAPGIAAQIILQPGQRFNVQMVGRLIQHQQIRSLQQNAGQSQTGLLASAQRGNRRLRWKPAEAHTVQNAAYPRIHLIAAMILEPIRTSGVALQQIFITLRIIRQPRIGNVCFELPQLCFRFDQRAEYGQHFLLNSLIRLQSAVLGQVTNGGFLGFMNLPAVKGHLACENLQEGRLPGSVDTDEAYPFLLVYLQADAVQHALYSI
ncbi:hypothetical protein D3C75_854320 [compost metagenome]